MTFVATANSVLYAGATPVFADVRPDDLLISPEAVAAAVTPATRAIIAVDYAGHPADYAALRAIADDAPGGPLTVIADASHSLGATLDGRAVGTLADLTVLSLHPAKIMTTAEGGAVLTDRDDAGRATASLPQPRHLERAQRRVATGPTRWSSSATTTG